MNADHSKEFVSIISQYQNIINNLCRIYYKDVEDQKDMRQDIVLQLWNAFPHFRAESKISTWIYRVSLNTILAKIRKQKRRIRETSYDEILHFPDDLILGTDDDIQQLKSMIELLKERDKAIVILYLEGYKNKEIAEILETSATNISTRLNRIRTELKTYYKKLTHADRSI